MTTTTTRSTGSQAAASAPRPRFVRLRGRDLRPGMVYRSGNVVSTIIEIAQVPPVVDGEHVLLEGYQVAICKRRGHAARSRFRIDPGARQYAISHLDGVPDLDDTLAGTATPATATPATA